ncbi:MAG TPA: hypothetical protein PLO24_03510 [Bacteroidales bacterium]|mgnify:CR=1 FL=1|jgi:opacity protein-like surface antigen|nr:hypothetical protein [Bacteroidales bacterium]HOS71409.1 hypothetical protein [Bacteroidales bacterium]HQH23712.1 hypothetical protein [Bacteroidales bacterium]HQJ82283.1 hypothetical protein [Bacteroidales bacterium]
MIRPLLAANKRAGRLLLIPVLFSFLVTAVYPQDKTISPDKDIKGLRNKGTPGNLKDVTAFEEMFTGSTSNSRIRFDMNAGAGYLLAGTWKARDALVSQGADPRGAESYYKNLKTGWSTGAGLTYMIKPQLGAGFRYRFFYTSGSLTGFFDPQDGIHLLYGTYGEKICVNFYGPSLSYHISPGYRKLQVHFAYSAGMTTYRNEAEYINNYLLISGRNLGIDASMGLEYFITDYLSAGAELSSFVTSLRKINLSDGTNSSSVKLDKKNYENLSRIELLLGIRFYFWNR